MLQVHMLQYSIQFYQNFELYSSCDHLHSIILKKVSIPTLAQTYKLQNYISSKEFHIMRTVFLKDNQ